MVLKCTHCKKEFEVWDADVQRGKGKFCSKACLNLWYRRPEIIVSRFWGFVDIGKPDECWEWQGCRYESGYGEFSYHGKLRRVLVRAHRFAYIITIGKIPRNLLACHTCDNPPCCNPDHIFIGTAKDNSQDSVRKRRHNYGIYNGKAKTDDIKVKRIFRLSFLGYSQSRIGKKLGLDQSNVGRILRRKGWPHVEIENYLLSL